MSAVALRSGAHVRFEGRSGHALWCGFDRKGLDAFHDTE